MLSPPPLSPDSPEWDELDGFKPPGTLSGDTFSYTNYYPTFDPFSGTCTDESDRDRDRDSTITSPPAPQQNQHVRDRVAVNSAPANLFSKTCLETEGSEELQKERKEEGEVLKAANAGRKSLNVDAFKTLLLTGRVGDEATSVPPMIDHESMAQKSATATSTSETIATPEIIHGGFDDDTSAESSEGREEEEGGPSMPHSQQIRQDRKPPPPPPPSSRHGKSISVIQQESAHVPQDARDARDARDVLDNKWKPQQQPHAESTWPRSNTIKKPAPTPPPPRGHARSDSKLADSEGGPRPTFAEEVVVTALGSDSSIRAAVPAPPPPRRPHMASKQTSQPWSSAAPSVSSSNTAAHASTSTSTSTCPHQDEPANSAPPSPENPQHGPGIRFPARPPPPPARHPCTRRRPPSLNNVEAPSRRTSSEKPSREGPLPPPHLPAPPGKSADILADLNALQREVDALRGKMK